MTIAISFAAALVLLAAAAFFLIFRRLFSPKVDTESTLDWWRQFSLEKYRPMERLFSKDDYEFLASQPGFSPGIAKRLQAERRRVFRHYLRCLNRDFHRLHQLANLFMVHASQDRPELALALFRQRVTFRYALLAVHVRLVLQPVGLGTVDVRGLVRVLESMRDQLRLLQPQAAAQIA